MNLGSIYGSLLHPSLKHYLFTIIYLHLLFYAGIFGVRNVINRWKIFSPSFHFCHICGKKFFLSPTTLQRVLGIFHCILHSRAVFLPSANLKSSVDSFISVRDVDLVLTRCFFFTLSPFLCSFLMLTTEPL